MSNEIKVPRLDWLIGGSRIGGKYNRYFGSVGTDPEKGCLCTKMFNYSVWIEKDGETGSESIKAAVYGGVNSIENTDKSEIETADFDLSEDSLPRIKSWLEGKCDEFLS